MRQLDGRGRDVDHVVLGRERLDDDAIVVQPARDEQFLDGGARQLQLPRVQIDDRRNGLRLDPLLRELLDVPEKPALARFREGDGNARAPRPARAADAMHVRVRRRRHIEVHHVRDAADVETARRDIRRDEHVEAAVSGAESPHDSVAFVLGETAVQRRGAISVGRERFGELIDLAARATEHDGGLGIFHVEHAAQRGDLLLS